MAPVYRRRRVPMDDLIALSDGVRVAVAAVLAGPERVPADAAIIAAIAVFRWSADLGRGPAPESPPLGALQGRVIDHLSGSRSIRS